MAEKWGLKPLGSLGKQGRTGLNTIHPRGKDTEPHLPSGASRSTDYPALWACPRQKGAGACTRMGSARQWGVCNPNRSVTPPSTKTKHHRPCNPLTQPMSPVVTTIIITGTTAECFFHVKHDYLI